MTDALALLAVGVTCGIVGAAIGYGIANERAARLIRRRTAELNRENAAELNRILRDFEHLTITKRQA